VDVFNFAQGRANNTFQAAETLSYNAGRHRLMGGADFRRTQLNSRLDRNFRPVVYFGGAVDVSNRFGVTNPFVPNTNGLFRGIDFIATGAATGFFHTLSLDGDSSIALRLWQGNLFAEDQIALAPNFKLTLGARYELNSVPRDVNSRIEATFNSPEVRALIAEEKRLTGVSGFERYLGDRTGIFQLDRNNLAPHAAFAWDPLRDGRTVIRGGYGMYFDQIPGAVISQSRSVFPRFLTVNLAGVSENRQSFIAFNPQRLSKSGALNVFDPNARGALGRNFLDYLIALNRLAQGPQGAQIAASPSFVLPVADLVTPYAQHWTLTVEREVLPGVLTSLAYVGTRGTNLLRFATPNLGPNGIPIVTGGTVFANEISFNGLVVAPGGRFSRPFPLLGSFTTIESDTNSSYHALQAEASMRLSSRVQFTAAYTWSHAIDEVSDIFDLAGARGIAQNSFDRGGERGDANFDVRHRFAGSFVWDLPFWRDRRLLGGWQLAGIAALQTGQPFTVVSSVDVNLDGNLTDRLNTTAGVNAVNDGALRYAFPGSLPLQRALLADAGNDGAVGRNTFRALDLAVNKFFRLTEAQRLELRAECFNLFNRTHFGIPARQLFAPALGRSVNTTVPARTVQFAVRYKF
jgi:TonB dependent receptor